MTSQPRDANGLTPAQIAAVRRQEERNAAIARLHESLVRGRSSNSEVGDFDRSKAK